MSSLADYSTEELGLLRKDLIGELAAVEAVLSSRESVRAEVAGSTIFSALLANSLEEREARDDADTFVHAFVDERVNQALEKRAPASTTNELVHQRKGLTKASRKAHMDPQKRLRSRLLYLTQKELGMIRCADPKLAMETIHSGTAKAHEPRQAPIQHTKADRGHNRQAKTFQRKC